MAKIEFLSSEEVWETISKLARAAKSRQVAVAYVGSDAIEMLPLGKGDTLVVDMSEKAVQNGATNPAIVRRFFEKGVGVFSWPGLHAKVFVLDQEAVVGSANVSRNSRKVLTEAVLLTSDSAIVESCREFIEELVKGLEPLTIKQLANAQHLYRAPKWTPGSGLPERKSRADWAYNVMAALKKPLRHRARHGNFIDLSQFSNAVGTAYFGLDPSDDGIGRARLDLYPADIVLQARPFYSKVDVAGLIGLIGNGWNVTANLHFGGSYGKGWPPYVTRSPLGLSRYIQFWKANQETIRSVGQSGLLREIRRLQNKKVIPRNLRHQELAALRAFTRVGIRPGVRLTFRWRFSAKLPDPSSFAPKLRARIDEALQTWGDSFS